MLQLITFEGHTKNVTSVSFHSEGKWLVTGSEDGTIKIWDLRFVDCTLFIRLNSYLARVEVDICIELTIMAMPVNPLGPLGFAAKIMTVQNSKRCLRSSEPRRTHFMRPSWQRKAMGSIREHMLTRTGASATSCSAFPMLKPARL